jgi:hypothetical protein
MSEGLCEPLKLCQLTQLTRRGPVIRHMGEGARLPGHSVALSNYQYVVYFISMQFVHPPNIIAFVNYLGTVLDEHLVRTRRSYSFILAMRQH